MCPASAPLFASVLIANRGEIAARTIRACAELGIRSVAVYSEADRDALHVRLADDAQLIGPGPAAESYLSISRIIAAARAAGAQAIHPGYGFLSEQADFAEACSTAGIVFVGPSPAAMRLLGDKAAARKLAVQVGVPTVPGYHGDDQDDATLTTEAARIGYPLLVKAAAGGGGRGMRVAQRPDELLEALAAARRESLAAFGNDTLLLERLLVDVRHIEVQILGDQHGALVSLGERDCSVQRRHQKVIEECPAPGLAASVRAALAHAALRIARAAAYTNAGTCEFLVAADGQFWFIEMNARLQVEHPVTELVTGIDLVGAQFEIAAGRPLPWRQDEIRMQGHAIECRIYAEDPAQDGLPATGQLVRFRPPGGPGLRHDLGYADGDDVPPFYDTMLGKLIAHGPDRGTAITRARAALDQYDIAGLPTNRALLTAILDHPVFVDGAPPTDWLAGMGAVLRADIAPDSAPPPQVLAAAVAWTLALQSVGPVAGAGSGLGDWRIAGQGVLMHWLTGSDSRMHATVTDREGRHVWRVSEGEADYLATVADVQNGAVLVRLPAGDGAETSQDRVWRCQVHRRQHHIHVRLDGQHYTVRRAPPPSAEARPATAAEHGAAAVVAPLPGKVVAVLVTVGEAVTLRQPLIVVEAMKIESTLLAPRAGTVRAVHAEPGQAVKGGQVLVELVSL
jgi:3-methylcrotonyl-CoA carboxylase alpha subunit